MSIFSNYFILGMFLWIGSPFAQAASESITPNEASTLTTEKKAVIIDVRENDEWNDDHIAVAIHIPLKQLNDHLSELQQYKDTAIIMQCQRGGRSAKALELLKSAGFSNVYNMEGGIVAWHKAGLSTQQK